ncbi:MAG: hypothetical protein H7Y42_02475 [Chitinophagaceae bacterium]|nr:hypothetical protein [Chitinophagaceae bacterium]
MKLNRTTIILFFLLLVAAVFYRFIPGMPYGFTPHMTIALLGGAVIKDKKWAFILPLMSLFISDLIFHFLYKAGLTETLGFYDGQWAIYMAFILVTFLGFLMRRVNIVNVAMFSIAGSILFFLISNYITWEVGQGLGRPKTFEGLMLCYGDGIAFYRQFGLIKGFQANFILGDLAWSAILFSSYFFIKRYTTIAKPQLA